MLSASDWPPKLTRPTATMSLHGCWSPSPSLFLLLLWSLPVLPQLRDIHLSPRVRRWIPSSFCRPGHHGNTPPICHHPPCAPLLPGQWPLRSVRQRCMLNVKNVYLCWGSFVIVADSCQSPPELRCELQNTAGQPRSFIPLHEHLLTPRRHTNTHAYRVWVKLRRWARPHCVLDCKETQQTKAAEEHGYWESTEIELLLIVVWAPAATLRGCQCLLECAHVCVRMCSIMGL